jgi:inner membrane protein
MDNLCHTLVGAAVGETGLKRQARWGNAILMLTANLPDLDVLSFATSTPAVAIRRGWTHGVLAQVWLPVLFTAAVLLLDRLRPARDGSRARAGPVLLLSYIGVLSHVGLDWLNNYGVRLLAPLSNRWFYGDPVFIIDPWLWLVLGTGVFLARSAKRPRRAGVAIGVAVLYIGGMVMSGRAARRHVLDAWSREHGRAPEKLMVGPAFANPFRRTIILEADGRYRTGEFTFAPRTVAFDPRSIPKNAEAPGVAAARTLPDFRAVLIWARFPYYETAPAPGGTAVTLRDVRFGSRVGAVSTIVPDPHPNGGNGGSQ